MLGCYDLQCTWCDIHINTTVHAYPVLGQEYIHPALSVMQVPCYDVYGYPTLVGLQGVGDTSPARGRPVANVLLCLGCVYVFSGNS
jgi:hypothetical protein